mgnify:CR=1 FL=1
MAKGKKTQPPVSYPRKPHNPIMFLINAAVKMGLGAKAVKGAYEYMADRDWQPFRPGDHNVDKDYYDKPMTRYDHRGTDYPMTTQTGQTIYDARKTEYMPDAGERVVHTPPMQGERKMKSYDMRDDIRTTGYYRDEDTGEIIAYPGPQAKGKPSVLGVSPEEEVSRSSGEGVINNPDEYQFFENPEAIDHNINTVRDVSDELQRHDVNFIEEYEMKDFEDKPTTIPW